MAITIVATPGSASANSFVTEAEAIAYAATRLNLSGWTTVTGSTATEDEKKALVEATREISRLIFSGYVTDAVQVLAWPRSGVINVDSPVDAVVGTYTGYPEYADNVIPTRLKEATIELAMEALKAGATDIFVADSNQGVIEESVDVLTTRWQPGHRPIGLARYPRVLRLIQPLLASGSGQRAVIRS